MTTRRSYRFAFLPLFLLTVLCAYGDSSVPAGYERYRVEASILPGDALQVIAEQVANTYRARLETVEPDGAPAFIVTMSEASAALMRRDPRVLRIMTSGDEPAPAVAEPLQRPGVRAAPIQPLATSEWGQTYQYDGSGNIKSINGRPFVYDAFSRVVTAPTDDGHKQSYTYDRYGNILTITTDDLTSLQKKIGVDPATNRASDNTSGYNVFGTYDAAGNMTRYLDLDDFAYDGLGMVYWSNVNSAQRYYVYTANDERIGTIVAAGTTPTEVSSEWTIRDLSARVLRRVKRNGGTWSWDEDYIHGDRLLAAEVPGPEKTLHFHLDHLGTPRLITGNGGAKVALHNYHAFGKESSESTQDAERLKFTGHERDAISLDYMHARYYNPEMGRFLSVDPGRDWDPQQPQSWNTYSYVRNNPTNRTDPTGRYIETWIDVGFIAYDLLDMAATKISGEQITTTQKLALAADVAGVAIPLFAGGGAVVRVGSKADDALDLPQPEKRSTDFVVTPSGEVIPIPSGASGPYPPQRGTGMSYQGGSGGNGMDKRTTGVRIMDANKNQGPRVNYMNAQGQTVNPKTGRTIPKDDPAGHIPLKKEKSDAPPPCTTGTSGCPK